MINVAVIGAGLSGLVFSCLINSFVNVTIFEKSRGVGGRLATRRRDNYEFDHGALFFKAKTESFNSFVLELQKNNIVVPWSARFAEFENNKIINTRNWTYGNYVGVNSMNDIAKFLSKDLNIIKETKIINIIKNNNDKFVLLDDRNNEYKDYDYVILAIPSNQAIEILPDTFLYKSNVQNIKMKPCYTVMLGFEESFDLGFDAAYVGKADISFVSVNSSKPKRKSSMSVVINSTNKFAEENLEKNQEEILSYLVQYSSNLLNIDLTKAKHKDLQRWRYANCLKQKSEHYSYFDFESKIGVIGDFCIQGRVECAFLSAQDLFKKFKQLILI